MTRGHPLYYGRLRQRALASPPDLNAQEREEWRLHLLICLPCRYEQVMALAARDPAAAGQAIDALRHELAAGHAGPYLRGLAQTTLAHRPLSPFQLLLWEVVQHDTELLGQYRLWEAVIRCRPRTKRSL